MAFALASLPVQGRLVQDAVDMMQWPYMSQDQRIALYRPLSCSLVVFFVDIPKERV